MVGFNQSDWRETTFDDLMRHGVVDAHHHMVGRAQRKSLNPGLLAWIESSYLGCLTLQNVGPASSEWLNQDLPDEERVRALLPLLRFTRATTYYQIVRQGLLSLFGFDFSSLNESNWQDIDKLIRQANNREDWFEEVQIRRMNLKGAVLDRQVGGTHVDAMTTKVTFDWYEYILKVRPRLNNDEVDAKTAIRYPDGQITKNSLKIDSLFYGYLKCLSGELKQLFGGEPESIGSLDDYLRYIDDVFSRIGTDSQNVALKVMLCGMRSLDFQATEKWKAERVFTAKPDELLPENAADFENFLMHYVCEKAVEYGLPIQFHVAAGPGGHNSYANARAGLLIGLILRHPQTKFDLMHGGYPHYGECGSLASRFPNVYLNLAWMTMMSDAEVRRVLDNWLDYVPVSKLMWSGDCWFIEETYGSYLVSREQMIEVLGNKIARGQIDQDDALFYLRRIFRDNAMELFRLSRTVKDVTYESS